MTGINEDDTGISSGSAVMTPMPTIVSRAFPLIFTVKNANIPGSIRVYNIRGQLVKNLRSPAGSASGDTRVAWFLNDESGKTVPSGIYFIRHENGKTCEAHKLIIAD